ncbi:Uncharacterized protein ImpJ/VasE [Patulibacter medicamentivorans]|uniref:Uncharacterized protein ImpJ/VasE n=1 Tax=Patulibacter medicamentivorans TaxID=1097667 RepID=H0E5E6_9ACTN|nr:Uncharacterized protein ImpJ/VasE [Patulibacter medicamentivorans]
MSRQTPVLLRRFYEEVAERPVRHVAGRRRGAVALASTKRSRSDLYDVAVLRKTETAEQLLRRGRGATCTTTLTEIGGDGILASTKRSRSDLYDPVRTHAAPDRRASLLRRGRGATCTTCPPPVQRPQSPCTLLRRGRGATCTTTRSTARPSVPRGFYEEVAERPVRRADHRLVRAHHVNCFYEEVAERPVRHLGVFRGFDSMVPLLRRGRGATCTTRHPGPPRARRWPRFYEEVAERPVRRRSRIPTT